MSTYKNACASLVRIITLDNYYRRKLCDLRSGPLENLWEGGGKGGRSTTKYWRKGKLNEKNYACQLTPKKYSCYGLKKIRTRNLITKKNSCGSKIPHPPLRHNFSNGQSLIHVISFSRCASSCSLSIFCRSHPGITAEIL